MYALAAGTEGGPRFTQLAKGNAGFAMGLLAVLVMLAVKAIPTLAFAIAAVSCSEARLHDALPIPPIAGGHRNERLR